MLKKVLHEFAQRLATVLGTTLANYGFDQEQVNALTAALIVIGSIVVDVILNKRRK